MENPQPTILCVNSSGAKQENVYLVQELKHTFTMDKHTLAQILQKIDQINATDPNTEDFQGKLHPKELLYSQRMSALLKDFAPQAAAPLVIAARAQHIARWKIQRSSYPEGRVGYLKWRNELKQLHASLTAEILEDFNIDSDFIKYTSDLIQKKSLKKNPDAQALEDIACLVFLKYYFEAFARQHKEEKLIDILRKTWHKMSEKGHHYALELPLSKETKTLISKALDAS